MEINSFYADHSSKVKAGNGQSGGANSGGDSWIVNVQTGLDVAGIADSTGIVDGVNALIYAIIGQEEILELVP